VSYCSGTPVQAQQGRLLQAAWLQGTGDTLSMELYGEKGSIRFTTAEPGFFEYYLEETGKWTRIPIGKQVYRHYIIPVGTRAARMAQVYDPRTLRIPHRQ
jgi:predicted dehydrogenase